MQERTIKYAQAFGQILQKTRREAGLSQEKLAFKADLDRTHISLLERGLRIPSIAVVFFLANALNTKPHTLIKQTENLVN